MLCYQTELDLQVQCSKLQIYKENVYAIISTRTSKSIKLIHVGSSKVDLIKCKLHLKGSSENLVNLDQFLSAMNDERLYVFDQLSKLLYVWSLDQKLSYLYLLSKPQSINCDFLICINSEIFVQNDMLLNKKMTIDKVDSPIKIGNNFIQYRHRLVHFDQQEQLILNCYRISFANEFLFNEYCDGSYFIQNSIGQVLVVTGNHYEIGEQEYALNSNLQKLIYFHFQENPQELSVIGQTLSGNFVHYINNVEKQQFLTIPLCKVIDNQILFVVDGILDYQQLKINLITKDIQDFSIHNSFAGFISNIGILLYLDNELIQVVTNQYQFDRIVLLSNNLVFLNSVSLCQVVVIDYQHQIFIQKSFPNCFDVSFNSIYLKDDQLYVSTENGEEIVNDKSMNSYVCLMNCLLSQQCDLTNINFAVADFSELETQFILLHINHLKIMDQILFSKKLLIKTCSFSILMSMIQRFCLITNFANDKQIINYVIQYSKIISLQQYVQLIKILASASQAKQIEIKASCILKSCEESLNSLWDASFWYTLIQFLLSELQINKFFITLILLNYQISYDQTLTIVDNIRKQKLSLDKKNTLQFATFLRLNQASVANPDAFVFVELSQLMNKLFDIRVLQDKALVPYQSTGCKSSLNYESFQELLSGINMTNQQSEQVSVRRPSIRKSVSVAPQASSNQTLQSTKQLLSVIDSVQPLTSVKNDQALKPLSIETVQEIKKADSWSDDEPKKKIIVEIKKRDKTPAFQVVNFDCLSLQTPPVVSSQSQVPQLVDNGKDPLQQASQQIQSQPECSVNHENPKNQTACKSDAWGVSNQNWNDVVPNDSVWGDPENNQNLWGETNNNDHQGNNWEIIEKTQNTNEIISFDSTQQISAQSLQIEQMGRNPVEESDHPITTIESDPLNECAISGPQIISFDQGFQNGTQEQENQEKDWNQDQWGDNQHASFQTQTNWNPAGSDPSLTQPQQTTELDNNLLNW